MGKKDKSASLKILDEAALRKKYSKYARRADIEEVPQLFIPSRSLAINHQLGGGLPYGRILELIGFESTGKTLLAIDFAYITQYLGGIVLWDDAENTWSNAWAKKNGIDPARVHLFEDNAIEPASDWIRDMIIYNRSKLVNNEPILLVIDSLAALECEDNIDSDQADGKAEMGNRAKAIYKMYRKRNKFFKKYGVAVIAINQVREKVGASIFEAAETTPGGSATKFYATQRVCLIRSKQVVKGEEKIGQNIIIQVRKNKIAPPQGSLRTAVYFKDKLTGYLGYDRYKGVPDILVEEKIVKKKGSRYYYKDKVIANGEDKFLEVLASDDELRKKLIRKSSINTASKLKSELSNIKENLFPVKIKTKSSDDQEEENK